MLVVFCEQGEGGWGYEAVGPRVGPRGLVGRLGPTATVCGAETPLYR